MQHEADSGSRTDADSPDRRLNHLLERMTLAEKAAQLGSVSASRVLDEDGDIDRESAEELLANGIGHFSRIGGGGGLDPQATAETTNRLQRHLREETRLGIPAIPHEECLSGYLGPEATTFPQGIGLASTWSPALAEEMTAAIRTELEAIGAVHALSPVLDVARDLRWGRVEETFGEDPYLVAAMACGYVEGLQNDGDGVAATLKHFAGHAASEGGKNRASVSIGPRELREVHLFPFEAVIRTTDVDSVMNAYHDIDGMPCAADEWLLTDVLRGEWGFEGTVVSDYGSIELLQSDHGIVASKREAGIKALEAGLDVELPFTDCYGSHLVAAVEAGELAESTLDRAVRRVLRAKRRAGLFEDPAIEAAAAPDAFGQEDHRALSERVARESITLLKNEGDLLPLDGEQTGSVAVIGPKAEDVQGMMGDYAYPAHYPEEAVEMDATTPREAVSIRGDAEEFDVRYAKGCTTTGPSTDGFEEAIAAAEDSDIALAFVGARSAVEPETTGVKPRDRPEVPTSGESCDVTDLGLPGVQQELVETLGGTETPLVVVLITGKPHSIEWIAEEVPAVLDAWLPGERGGNAIDAVLFGEHNPSGHLPVSFPRSVGQLPVNYNRRPNTANKEYVYTDSEPLYPFGHGLSYTKFVYEDFTTSTSELPPAGSLTASVTVRNAGDQPGHDVVQLYAHAKNPSRVRPVQELVGFARVSLDPGDSVRVSFDVHASQFAFRDHETNLVVERGPYELRVGRSSTDLVASESVVITGTKRVPDGSRTYFSGTRIKRLE